MPVPPHIAVAAKGVSKNRYRYLRIVVAPISAELGRSVFLRGEIAKPYRGAAIGQKLRAHKSSPM
jgi:hypothetical protein